MSRFTKLFRGLVLSLMLVSVSIGFAQSSAQQTYVELILDASGSMWNTMDDGRTRIQVAKEVLKEFIQELPNGDINVGLRIYGSEVRALETGACEDSRLFVPLDGVDKASMIQNVDDATAQGSTPIAYSLRLAAQDFPADAGKRLIVIVTDGEESCEEGLDAVVAELQAMGIELDLQIIGLDLNERAIESFEGVGNFVNAASAAELASALEVAVEEVIEEVMVEEVVETTCEDLAATIEPAAVIYASTSFTTGVNGVDGTLYIHPIGGDDYSSLESSYYLNNGAIELVAPSVAGSYELRYKTFSPECVLATMQIEVLEIQATINAPEQVRAGETFEFSYEGPDGTITIFETTDPDEYKYGFKYSSYSTGHPKRVLRAPSEVRDYEIRYLDRNRNVMATRLITVLPSLATLEAPEEVEAGYEFEFSYDGPEGIIAIVDPTKPDENKYGFKYDSHNVGHPKRVLLAPSAARDYEIQYIDRNRAVIARQVLTVLPSQAVFQIPEQVEAGYEFEFSYEGPDGIISVYDLEETEFGRYHNKYSYYRFFPNSNTVLRAPSGAGMYDIHYLDKDYNSLYTSTLEVLPSQATLSVPSNVTVGETFSFSFDGPKGNIGIFEAGEQNTRLFRQISYYDTTLNKDSVELKAPEQAGSYEVRYIDDNLNVLVTQPLTVR